MAGQERLEVGNNTIEARSVDEFAAGYRNGYLYYYDTNHRLPRPLTTESVYRFMAENLSDERATAEWNSGFVFGWIAALCENDPAFFFTSLIIPESVAGSEALPVAALQAQQEAFRRRVSA
jgi:hypothetical protein